jgi:hypothetical protein
MGGARCEGGVEVERGVVGVGCLWGGFGHFRLCAIVIAAAVSLRVPQGLRREWRIMLVVLMLIKSFVSVVVLTGVRLIRSGQRCRTRPTHRCVVVLFCTLTVQTLFTTHDIHYRTKE